ncbi:MAG: nuclear transport factor 2 family protein [Bradyrhizobium sp.]
MSGEELMRTAVAAFAQSDIKPLLDALHEDVVWKSASKQEGLFRFHGEYKNRAGVMEILSLISLDYTFHHMKPKEIVTVGDVVWGYFDVGLSYETKGKAAAPKFVQLDMAIRWCLKEGKIIEHQAFFDTAYLLMQQRNVQP